MSKNKYECFKCKDNGFPGTMVHLAGKDDDGKTVYMEDDGLRRSHKTKDQTQQQQQTTAATTTSQQQEPPYIKTINARLDRVITLLEEMKKTG